MKKIIKLCFSIAVCFSLFAFPIDANRSEIHIINEEVPFDEVSEPMTYDEMITQIAMNEGITFEEAERKLGPQSRDARLGTYRTLYQTIVVTSVYKPQLRFYVETSESGSFHGILSIEYVNMNRAYNGISKQFSGTVAYVLTDPNNIHYSIDGDFFNNGSTTTSLGGSVNIGGFGSSSFTVSSTTSHYAYCSDSGDKYW